jgi:hypothetical protein
LSANTWSVGRSLLFTGAAFLSMVFVDQMVGCMSASAQQRSGIAAATDLPPATADDLIRQMADSAPVIFVGDVVEVRRSSNYAGSPVDAAEGSVEVDFLVDVAVRGSHAREIYTLREWGGLWAGGTDRYRTGQRFLMLLREPGSSGFSSPVHGFEGAIPLHGSGSAPGPYSTSSAGAQWMVDTRWLQAQMIKAQIHPPKTLRDPDPNRGTGGFHSETAIVDESKPLLVHALPGPWLDVTVVDAPTESLSHVLGLCAARVDR